MPQFLSTADADFEARFVALLDQKREDAPDVHAAVAGIIADVRARGDAAVAGVPAEERAALDLAAERIRSYHARQMPDDRRWTEKTGAVLGWRWTPVAAAGLYVPGGLASYPSSVLMNAVPARVAGVERLVVTVPTPGGEINPLLLYAARISGVDEIYRVGGAQAIAALAWGTEMIRPVDVVTGPGNAYVAAAKAQVFGQVGIDMIAGPSEILIIADGANDPDWIAIDLLSQAEHDPSAQAILITTEAEFGRAVARAVEAQITVLDRAEIAGASWRDFGAVITVADLGEAAALCDRIAPEHLELAVENPEALLANIRNAGAVFLGAWTPEAIGDYVGGPNHVLPTARSARFSSGLSVLDFLKRTTITQMTPTAVRAIGPAAETLARSESLGAHGASVRARLDALNS